MATEEQPDFEEYESEDYDPLSDDLLLAEMVRAIVAFPDRVEIEEYCDATKPTPVKVLIVRVDSRDCGKVIGRQGRMAELLRSFMTTVGIHHGYQMTVMIEGSNDHQPRRQPNRANHRKSEPDIEYLHR
jgi:predicted RNA-binding protein YlqC (UPF0109 family)